MLAIQFGQRLAEVMPQRLSPTTAAAAPPEAAPTADQLEFSGKAGTPSWLPQLARWQTQFGTQGCGLLVGLAEQVGQELVTPQQESKWASRVAFANSTYESSINPRLESICKKLADASTLGDLKLSPILEERSAINAQAQGGGLINITMGMVELFDQAGGPTQPQQQPARALHDYMREHGLQSEDLLAAVLAHEVAHIEHRDIAASWGQQVLTEQLGMCGTQGPGHTLLMELPEALQNSNWEKEFRADQRGSQLLEKAGYPKQNLKHMLVALQMIETAFNKPATDQDHPPLSQRLARAENF
ncbi:M48 family metalloprotease [bacterium]|nr:M48 family metalloprotease [bacterium]